MDESILNSIKKTLGMDADYDAFDADIIMHINSTFSVLDQLGVGPEGGFMITDDSTTWGAFLGGNPQANMVKTYMFLRVKNSFDPPATGFHQTAMEKQIEEFGWRLNVWREGKLWVPADGVAPGVTVLDGGVQ